MPKTFVFLSCCCLIFAISNCGQRESGDIDKLIQQSWEYNGEARRTFLKQAIQDSEDKDNPNGLIQGMFFLGYYYESSGKAREADSLYTCLLDTTRKYKNLEWEVATIAQLANVNTYLRKLDKADSLLKEALVKADGQSNERLKGDIYLNQAVLSDRISDNISSILSLSKALDIFVLLGDIPKQIQTLNYLGVQYAGLGIYDLSSEYYLRAAELALSNGNASQYASAIYQSGINLNEIGEFESALALGKKALPLIQNDSAKYARILNNIGVSYSGLFKDTPIQAYYDSSLTNIYKSYTIKLRINDQSGLAFNFLYLGKLQITAKKFNDAKKDLKMAYTIWSERKDNDNIVMSALELANVNIELQHFDSARFFVNRAKELASEPKARLKMLDTKGRLELELGDLAEYRKTIQEKDSLYEQYQVSQQNVNAAATEVRLRTSELAAEKKLLIGQNRYQKTILIGLGGFSLVVISFMIMLALQRKKLKQLNLIIEKKNQRILALNKQNYHFTKNSLTEIAGMLNLQLTKIPEGMTKQTLMLEKLRMDTLNILYNLLFKGSENLTQRVELDELIRKIVANSFDTMLPENFLLDSQLKLESIELDQETGLSIAMIMNELCINSSKYAFKKRQVGKFSIDLFRKEKYIFLIVGDDGPGYSNTNFNNQSAGSFGMELINLMVQDLDAEMKINNTEKGLKYSFKIPLK
uniref:histidine kinase dimerization/phosphoacceptor domain -containing protein n=1 Tax=Roseivirga sp. TaxID=1964215 RepID=UPI004047FADA